jgi:sugar fermentation stimulation protein A
VPIIYTYPHLYSGKLLRRYKRFFADVELDSGEIVTAHCPNTGPMTDVCQIGAAVQLSYHDNPKRKLAYTWETIQLGGTWVGVNTGLPNKLIKIALEQHLFPSLEPYDTVRSEVVYGQDRNSRVDFVLMGGKVPIYLEVKNTTWIDGETALFPDTETTRGQKHLRELTALLPDTRAVMLYFINRGDATKFAPGDRCDRLYGELLRQGIDRGLEVLPCRFAIDPPHVNYLGMADLDLSDRLNQLTEDR